MGSGSASAATTAGFTMPAEAPPHGAPVRQYINSKITGVLLEGMKMVARDQYVFAVLVPPFSFPPPPSPRRPPPLLPPAQALLPETKPHQALARGREGDIGEKQNKYRTVSLT